MADGESRPHRPTRTDIILLVLLAAALLGGLWWSVDVASSLEKSRRINCISNLKGMGLALRMYAGDYGGEFPPELCLLAQQSYMTSAKVYGCPSTGTQFPKEFRSCEGFKTDYLYFYREGFKDDSPDADTTVIGCDRPGNHRRHGNVLYASGRVKGFQGRDWPRQAGIEVLVSAP